MFVSNSGSGGYEIANSLRFRSSASAYLSRTFGTPTDNNVWTWSGWVKRGALGGTQVLFGADSNAAGANICYIRLDVDKLDIVQDTGGSTSLRASTTAVFRDPSAWYHVQVVFNTDEAVATDRLKIYVNNTPQAVTYATGPLGSAAASQLNVASRSHQIGRLLYATTQYFDGYLSEVNFIDGQALTPSSFGQTDSNGVWTPKQYSGTYGTNGFYLKFNDGSSTTNLCLDRSGNGNNWTPSGISVSAGVTYDWMSDTPTNVYSTLNPLDTLGGVMAEGNLAFTSPGVGYGGTRATMGVSSGKWYWEVTANSMTGGLAVGISSANEARPLVPGESAASYGYQSDALKRNNLTPVAYGATWTTNDVIGVALDLDAGTLVFYKNNTSQGTAYSSISGTFLPMVSDINNSAVSSAYINFGQRPFTYTPPTGFKALCTANLPAVTIANPKRHFDVLTHTGNGAASQNVTGVGFQPDFAWIKCRNVVDGHALVDIIRGGDKPLQTNSTNAETTGNIVDAWLSGGITANLNINVNTRTYVDWLWKANGAGVTNTSGTITSTVSANTTAGFSIVTYTGTGANATVGHGLGVAPRMVILKTRGASTDWAVWHTALTGTQFLSINNTNAVGTAATLWNSTVPSSTVISVGTSIASNSSGNSHVAHCFAEVPGFSRIGSYTGNGSADGPFVYCGFRPRFIMTKRTDNSFGGDWYMYDAARDTVNVASSVLFANGSNAESTTAAFDLTSNGFKVRSSAANFNNSTSPYIFIAFAESPFGGNNIAPSTAR